MIGIPQISSEHYSRARRICAAGAFNARIANARLANTFAKTPPTTTAKALGQMTEKSVSITKYVMAHPPSAPAPIATVPADAPIIAARNAKLVKMERRVAPNVFKIAAS
jgi:hypothetical protein